MLRLLVIMPQLLWLWRLLQLLDEVDEDDWRARPEDVVKRRLSMSSQEERYMRRRDRQLANQAAFDELVRLITDKARLVSRALNSRDWPGAEVQEAVIGEASEPKRLFRRTSYRPIIEELVVWHLNEETDYYLGRDGVIYGDYDVLSGAFRPARLQRLNLATLKQLDHDLDSLRGRFLSNL